MPRPGKSAIADLADTLAQGEPGMAAVHGFERLGTRTVEAVRAGRKRVRSWMTPTPPATDIDLPNTSGRVDPRLKKRRATRGAARR